MTGQAPIEANLRTGQAGMTRLEDRLVNVREFLEIFEKGKIREDFKFFDSVHENHLKNYNMGLSGRRWGETKFPLTFLLN